MLWNHADGSYGQSWTSSGSYIYNFNLSAVSNNSRRTAVVQTLQGCWGLTLVLMGTSWWFYRILWLFNLVLRRLSAEVSLSNVLNSPAAPGVQASLTSLLQTTQEQQSPSHRKAEWVSEDGMQMNQKDEGQSNAPNEQVDKLALRRISRVSTCCFNRWLFFFMTEQLMSIRVFNLWLQVNEATSWNSCVSQCDVHKRANLPLLCDTGKDISCSVQWDNKCSFRGISCCQLASRSTLKKAGCIKYSKAAICICVYGREMSHSVTHTAELYVFSC